MISAKTLMDTGRRLKKRVLHTRLVDLSRLHEVEERRTLERIFATLPVRGVLDIGANKGSFAHNALRAMPVRLPIVCVEPNAAAIRGFEEEHAADKAVSVVHVAVSDKDAEGFFHITANDEFSSLRKPKPNNGAFRDKVALTDTIEIKTMTLDSLIAQTFPQCDNPNLLVKLDTQGMDYDILDRSVTVGRRASCIISEIEFSSLLYGTDRTWADHVEMVQTKGFNLAALYASNSGHFPDLHDMNAVFVNRAVLPNKATDAAFN